jgi:hypothetical protein
MDSSLHLLMTINVKTLLCNTLLKRKNYSRQQSHHEAVFFIFRFELLLKFENIILVLGMVTKFFEMRVSRLVCALITFRFVCLFKYVFKFAEIIWFERSKYSIHRINDSAEIGLTFSWLCSFGTSVAVPHHFYAAPAPDPAPGKNF